MTVKNLVLELQMKMLSTNQMAYIFEILISQKLFEAESLLFAFNKIST